MSTGKVILGVVAGAAVGAVVGMLFAPEKGKDLRQKIADKSGDAIKGVKDKLGQLGDKATGLVEKGKEKLEHLTEQVEDKATGLIEKGKAKVDGLGKSSGFEKNSPAY